MAIILEGVADLGEDLGEIESKVFLDDVQLAPDDGLTTPGGLFSISGLGTPSPRRETLPRPRDHGDVDYTEFYEGRVISLVGYVWGITAAEARSRLDAIKILFMLGTNHILKFNWTDTDEYHRLQVRVASALDVEMVGVRPLIKWSVDLLAPDPRIYSDTIKSGEYDPTTAGSGTGVAFPLVFPLVFTGEATTTLDVTNEGNFSTPPVFVVEGPVTNPIIDNETTGKSIQTTGLQLASGEFMTLNVAVRTLMIAEVNRLDFLNVSTTEWFELIPGINRLRLRGTGMSAAQTSLSVSYRDARI